MTFDLANQHYPVVMLFDFVQASDSDETWTPMPVGVLAVISEDMPLSPNHLHLDTVSIAIIIKGSIVMDNLPNLPQAVCLDWSVICFTLGVSIAMKNTLELIQRVILGLGQNNLQKLKILLLS